MIAPWITIILRGGWGLSVVSEMSIVRIFPLTDIIVGQEEKKQLEIEHIEQSEVWAFGS